MRSTLFIMVVSIFRQLYAEKWAHHSCKRDDFNSNEINSQSEWKWNWSAWECSHIDLLFYVVRWNWVIFMNDGVFECMLVAQRSHLNIIYGTAFGGTIDCRLSWLQCADEVGKLLHFCIVKNERVNVRRLIICIQLKSTSNRFNLNWNYMNRNYDFLWCW